MLGTMAANPQLLQWLKETCATYAHDVVALYRRHGTDSWPLQARNAGELEQTLRETRHFLPLPKEPAALANILEVAIVDFLIERVAGLTGAEYQRGTERGYPDIEFHGGYFGGGYHAVDVKIAMRKKPAPRKPGSKRPAAPKPPAPAKTTQSRITLYTGNTYFKFHQYRWPGAFRPFDEYESHIDVLGIYTLNEQTTSRVDDLELIVQEPWRIASKERSSTTREYLGAVMEIDRLREGRGVFETEKAFFKYWRSFKFKEGRAAGNLLQKILAEQGKGKSSK